MSNKKDSYIKHEVVLTGELEHLSGWLSISKLIETDFSLRRLCEIIAMQ